MRGSGLGRGAESGSALARLSRPCGPVRRLLCPPPRWPGLWCHLWSPAPEGCVGRWHGVLYPVRSALQAPGCSRGNPHSIPQGSVPRVRRSPWVARLSLPWVSKGCWRGRKQVPSGRCPRRAFPPLGPPRARFLLIDVVMSCSPGPGLSRVRRGTDIPGEWDRSSRSAHGSLAPPPPLPPAVAGGVCGGGRCGGCVGSGPTPLSQGSCLRVPVGVGSSDAADTLACRSWLPAG